MAQTGRTASGGRQEPAEQGQVRASGYAPKLRKLYHPSSPTVKCQTRCIDGKPHDGKCDRAGSVTGRPRGLAGSEWGAFPDDKVGEPEAEAIQNMTASLPPGWSAAWSQEQARYYFFHSESGVVSWEKPEDERSSSARGKSAASSQLQQQVCNSSTPSTQRQRSEASDQEQRRRGAHAVVREVRHPPTHELHGAKMDFKHYRPLLQCVLLHTNAYLARCGKQTRPSLTMEHQLMLLSDAEDMGASPSASRRAHAGQGVCVGQAVEGKLGK